MFGGHAMMVGGASIRRDDVGVVCIDHDGLLVDNDTMQLGAVASLAPGDQFDRSLRSVWIDKNKVELILRMTTNADSDHDNDTITTAQAFARVFHPRRLREWKRLVEERLWKSISFCRRRGATTDIGLRNFPREMLDRVTFTGRTPDIIVDHDQEEQRRPRNLSPPISNQEEQAMWRGLMEPCRRQTQRLELRGELTTIQARVVSSLYSKESSYALCNISAGSETFLSACHLNVLCLNGIVLTRQVAIFLGDIIHGEACPSCLKELSLSKCTIEQSAWSALLGHSTLEDTYTRSTDTDEDEANTIDIPPPNFHEQIDFEGEKEEGRKPSGKTSYTPRTSSLSSLPSPLYLSTLRALYLSDCCLRQSDVEEILSSLRRYPLLKTLFMNGEQTFDASQVDSLLIAHLRENASIENIQLPSRNHHSSQIQQYAELNRCGRRLLRTRRGHGLGAQTPMGLWPLVLERIQRVPGLTSTRRTNARYYFVKALHGISTTGGTGPS
jgi:hypothetical protein